MPLGYAQDEDELLDLDDSGDMSPYSKISNSAPLDDVSTGKNPDLGKYMASRRGMPASPLGAKDYTQDPLMKQYESEQGDLNKYRSDIFNRQNEQVKAIALGQIANQAARGPGSPESGDDVAKTLASFASQQPSMLLKSKEEDMDRRQKIVNAIEARQGREAVAKNTDEYRKLMLMMRAGQQDTANKNKNERMNSLNIGKANSLFSDPGINRETTKLNAARSAQTLIDEIKAGGLKSSKNIRNQLTTIMSTIEMGGPGAVHDRQAMGVDNLYTKVKDALAFIDSHPNDTINPETLAQLEIEANALGDRAAKNYNSLVDAKLSGADLSGGDPDVDPGQIHKLASQRKTKFLQTNGYDPNSGDPMKKRDFSIIPNAMAGEGGMNLQNAALEELKRRRAGKQPMPSPSGGN